MKVKFKDLLNVLDARAYIKVYDAETKQCVLIGQVYHHLATLLNVTGKGEVVDMQIVTSEIATYEIRLFVKKTKKEEE